MNVDLPSEEVLAQLDLEPREFGDFYRAFRVAVMQAQGMSVTAACDAIGLHRRSFYEEKWQKLMAKAQRLILGANLPHVMVGLNMLLTEWPAVLQEQIRIAKFGQFDRDRTLAAEFLYESYISKIQEQQADDKEERDYLKHQPNFSPMTPILNIQAGATVNINTPAQPAVQDVVDAEEIS